MKCKHCGAENPEQAEVCTVCAKPLKDNAPGKGKRTGNGNSDVQGVQPESGGTKHAGTNFGLAALIVGIISMLLSCVYLGFLGIVGIALGVAAIAKREVKTGKAIAGIVCSAIALFISLCVIVADPDENSSQTTQQVEKETEEAAEKISEPTIEPTPEPTMSPEEKSKNIQEALLAGKKEDLKKYSSKEVAKVAEDLLEKLSFEEDKDFDVANTVAGTMVSVYPDGLGTEDYEYIVLNYESYLDLQKEISSDEYEGIDERWDDVSEAAAQIISNTFSVRYDIEAKSSGSALDQIINAITGEDKEYKHAYYAVGYGYDFNLGMWTADDDQEYIIYTQDAFPKAGKYSLSLIPTGSSMQVTNDGGFEREIATYTMLSEEDEEEYSRIEQLKTDYDNLCDEMAGYKANIQYACSTISEQQEKEGGENENAGNDKESVAQKSQSGYICPQSDVKKLTVKEVKKLSKAERRLAKNEIYARYGRRFKDERLQKYFDKKSWYHGVIEPEDFDEGIFNKIEKYNVRLLAKEP